MSKPIIHIGIGLLTDSSNPLEGNLLQLTAVCGERTFNQCLQPLTPVRMAAASRYEVCPEVWVQAFQNQIPPTEAIKNFITWTTNFRSTPVAICNTLDFLWLHTYLRKFGNRFPFGDRLLDVGTWVAAKQNGRNPERKWSQGYINPETSGKLDPLSIAKHRLYAVMQGVSKEIPRTKPANLLGQTTYRRPSPYLRTVSGRISAIPSPLMTPPTPLENAARAMDAQRQQQAFQRYISNLQIQGTTVSSPSTLTFTSTPLLPDEEPSF